MISDSSRSAAALNPQQLLAANHGVIQSTERSKDKHCQVESAGPLLVMAGAGTGKTTTIAHRVSSLLRNDVDPARILLMTFSRRAALEMTQRAVRIVAQDHQSLAAVSAVKFPWSGTFHSIAVKLLRNYASHIGLAREFSILDRGDSADLMDVCRQELQLSRTDKRFPRKDVCSEIYSLCTNRQLPLKQIIDDDYGWCVDWIDHLKNLFRAYVQLKQETLSLDYDDLLLYWYYMMQEQWLAEKIGGQFDHVLVDEYQDTNVLQAKILLALKPNGRGVTVVGDDAQSIYSFRAADVNNIREFSAQYELPTKVVELEQNYRSHQAILDFANVLMEEQSYHGSRHLASSRVDGSRPYYVTIEDDYHQAKYTCAKILENKEQGYQLRQQAVLFRNSHHSDALEVELARCNIPFVKYGGLKFLEARHVKDMLCLLRWCQNPQDQLAAFRCMQLLHGIGPSLARKAWEYFVSHNYQFIALGDFELSSHKMPDWLKLSSLMRRCSERPDRLVDNLDALIKWYRPHLERIYSDFQVRFYDLEQLAMIASGYVDASSFLAELTLDPPSASGDLAGDPLKDEDYVILSTVHSAKGQEWSCVYILNVVDGSFPSEFSTGSDALIEEERRLLYVAGTRAKEELHLIAPLKFYLPQQRRYGTEHVYGAQSRFMTPGVLATCKRCFFGEAQSANGVAQAIAQLDLPAKIGQLW